MRAELCPETCFLFRFKSSILIPYFALGGRVKGRFEEILGRPFGAVTADFGRSRRRGWICTGRGTMSALPRGLGVAWGLFFGAVGRFPREILVSWSVLTNIMANFGSSRRHGWTRRGLKCRKCFGVCKIIALFNIFDILT